ncbi:MAG: nitroreductase family protein [Candidatus Limnocylindrales bacterium]|jgi:nitroreductase
METWQAINTTRAIRKFAARPLEPEHLQRILNAGRRSGSSKNQQSWDFVVCTDRTHLAELAGVGPYAQHLASAAAAVALVTPDPATAEAPLSVMWDLGRAAQNMTLAAWELGIGSVPATVYDQPLARELLALPAGRHCEFLLSFGYPADPAALTWPKRAGGRKPLEAIVHYERW